MEGSGAGSVLVTNGSRFGWPKNIRIQMQIRIPYTAVQDFLIQYTHSYSKMTPPEAVEKD